MRLNPHWACLNAVLLISVSGPAVTIAFAQDPAPRPPSLVEQCQGHEVQLLDSLAADSLVRTISGGLATSRRGSSITTFAYPSVTARVVVVSVIAHTDITDHSVVALSLRNHLCTAHFRSTWGIRPPDSEALTQWNASIRTLSGNESVTSPESARRLGLLFLAFGTGWPLKYPEADSVVVSSALDRWAVPSITIEAHRSGTKWRVEGKVDKWFTFVMSVSRNGVVSFTSRPVN